MFTKTFGKKSLSQSVKEGDNGDVKLRDMVEDRSGRATESDDLSDAINKVNREDRINYDEKAAYADRIFQYLMETYSRPEWNDVDAHSFNFSTKNAMRHFLRKYSDAYREYRELSQNSEFTVKRSSYTFPENLNRQPTRIEIERPSVQKVRQPRIEVVSNPEDIAAYVNDPALKQFIANSTDADILEQYKQTYSYRGNVEDVGLPVFDGKLQLAGDMLLVGDIHIPSTNWEFMERIVQIAKRHLSRPRKIVIVGDILNGDKDSRYEHIIAPISRYKEFKITDAVLQTWAKVFDEIYLTPGNHLHRLIRRLEGDIGMNELARLLTSAHEKVNMSHYDEVHIKSGDEYWVATHQQNYAKSKLKIGNLLSQKFQSNIVTFHQHHSALGRDDYNRYTIIDCGGMHRQDMMAYVKLVPNVMPNMNNGFVLLRDGTGHLLTPYPSITDWSMWV